MRIFEITGKNLTWAVLNGVNLEEIVDNGFEMIEGFRYLLVLNNPIHNKKAIHILDEIYNNLFHAVNIDWPDNNDPDIIVIKGMINGLIEEANSLKDQLNF